MARWWGKYLGLTMAGWHKKEPIMAQCPDSTTELVVPWVGLWTRLRSPGRSGRRSDSASAQ
jgi:hypothetical protein